MRCTSVFLPTLLLFSLSATSASAQPGEKYQLEIGMISSISFVSERHESSYYDSEWPTGNDDELYILIPSNAPGVRLTFWTASAILIDAAFMLAANSDNYGGEAANRCMIEMGLGADLGRGEGCFRPFIGAIGGAIMFGDSGSRKYVGGQAGFRYFVREYAALRAQVGHRTTLNDESTRYRVTELAAGIGFLL